MSGKIIARVRERQQRVHMLRWSESFRDGMARARAKREIKPPSLWRRICGWVDLLDAPRNDPRGSGGPR